MKTKASIIFFLLFGLAVIGGVFASGKPEELREINISYVRSPFNLQVMVMKERAMLEKAFEDDGIAVQWHEITSGAKQAEAMAAGSLDIASVINSASLIIANAAGNEIRLIDVVSRPEETFALMVGEDGPDHPSELSGAVVAGPKGTVLHQLLSAIIEKEELSDVKLISMGLPQAQAALLTGEVDAALLAASLMMKSQDAGAKILTTSEGYVHPLLVSACSGRFLEDHPEMAERYRKVQREAYEYILEYPEEAVAIGAREQGMSMEDARELYRRSAMGRELRKEDLASMEEDVSFLFEQGMIEREIEVQTVIAEGLDVH